MSAEVRGLSGVRRKPPFLPAYWSIVGGITLRLMSLRLAVLLGLAAAGSAALSSLLASPLPLLPVIAALVLTVAYFEPLKTTYVAVASLPLELYSANVGAGFGVTPTEGLLVAAAVGWSARRFIERQPVALPAPVTAPLALLVASVVPGLLVAPDVAAVAKQLGMWTAFFVLYLMVVNDGGREGVRGIVIALAVAGGVTGAIAVVESGGQQQDLSAFGTLATNRATGSFAQPNLLGLMLALAIPAQLVLAFRGTPWLRILAITALALTGTGLALSLSRGAFVGVIAVLAFFLLWRPFRVAALVAVAMVLCLSVVGVNATGPFIDQEVVVQRLTSTGVAVETVSDPRVLVYRAAPKMIEHHPLFGVGADNFVSLAPEFGLVDPRSGAVLTHAHNTPLAIVTELGLLGLAALAWVSVALAKTLLATRWLPDPTDRTYAFGIAGSFAALAVTGLFDHALTVNAVTALAFLLAGCAVALGKGIVSKDAPTTIPGRAHLAPVPRPVRVLFVTSAQLGGAEIALSRLIERLGPGWTAGVLAINDGPFVAEMRAGGYEVDILGVDSRSDLLRGVHRLRNAVRRLRPDVIHANGFRAATLVAASAVVTRVPVIWHKVDLARDGLPAQLLAVLSTHVVAISHTAARTFRARVAGKVSIVSYGIPDRRVDREWARREIETLTQWLPDHSIVVLSGRLCAAKGQADLIETVPEVLATRPGTRFLLLGGQDAFSPGYEQLLRDRIDELGLQRHVALLGHRDDAVALVAGCDLLVAPSRTIDDGSWGEGFGLVGAEAQLARDPCGGLCAWIVAGGAG